MKTEKEIRHFLSLVERRLKADAGCRGCPNCYARHVERQVLRWLLDGDDAFDRGIERFVEELAEDNA